MVCSNFVGVNFRGRSVDVTNGRILTGCLMVLAIPLFLVGLLVAAFSGSWGEAASVFGGFIVIFIVLATVTAVLLSPLLIYRSIRTSKGVNAAIAAVDPLGAQLQSEGLTVLAMTPAWQRSYTHAPSTVYVNNGIPIQTSRTNAKDSACVLALTTHQLIQYEPSQGSRYTLQVASVVATEAGAGSIEIKTPAEPLEYFPIRRNPAAIQQLLAFEAQLRQVMAMSRTASSGGPISVSAELARLSELASAGAISPPEWERAKQLFLGKPENARDVAARQLRQLYDLHRSGVLSESEFNSKKWDILARS